MTDLTPNIPLLRKAVEWAEVEAAKPEAESEWRQRFWVTPASDEEAHAWGENASFSTAASTGRCGTAYCLAGHVVFNECGPTTAGVSDLAVDLLGLTQIEALHLFHPTNTIEDVRRIAEEIAGERL